MPSSRRLWRCVCVSALLLLVAVWLLRWLRVSDDLDTVKLQIIVDMANSPSRPVTRARRVEKRPIVYMDKDITNKTHVRHGGPYIPRIIHQTWKGYDIPSKFVPLVKSWVKVNPEYEYWMWTDEDAARFVRLRFPQFYDMYKNYPQNIHRADAMRYFILWEFGGWYADMDIEAIKPIDGFSRSHQCVISQEPWAHTKIFWNKNRLACNALMAARPRHPLFNLIIRELPNNDKRTSKGEVMAKTGPKMVDSTVTLYEKLFKDNFTENMSVYLADPNTFLPTLASNALALLKQKCSRKQNDVDKQKICDEYIKSGYKNAVPDVAYTNHVWVHTYYGIDEKQNENIFNLIPKTVRVKELLDRLEKQLHEGKSLSLGKGF